MNNSNADMVAPLRLPRGWEWRRLKYIATCNDDVLPENTGDFEELRYVEISDVSLVGGVEGASNLYFHEAPSRARRRVKSGDILISTVRTYLKAIAAVPAAESNLVASTGFCVVRPGPGMDSGYLGWVAKSEPFVGEIVARSVGVSYPAIKPSELATLDVPLPSLEAQRRIAHFLDEKTARIDALIAKKRALLERLAEKRQALITQAVTKGLNPAVPMKDSGVTWYGKIPAHWEVLPLRRLVRKVATGRTPPSSSTDYFSDGEINWFTPGDYDGGIELQEASRKITQEALDDAVSTLYPCGTVFLVGIGATLGKVAVGTVAGSANQQINAIIPDDQSDPYYLAYLLHGFQEAVRNASNGNTLGILNQDATKSLEVIRPPCTEQQGIAVHCRQVDAQIGDVIKSVAESVDRLTEYRAALVTAAVTGQLPALNG